MGMMFHGGNKHNSICVERQIVPGKNRKLK